MTPVVTITMLWPPLWHGSAVCCLACRGVMLAMIGVAHMLARQPTSAHHILLHGFHLLLVFNVTYAAFALLSALVF